MDSYNSEKNSFVKQASFLVAAGFIVRFIGFLYRLPLTDMIGDEGNGIYGMGYNVYNFLLILSSAGMPVAISKLVSERSSLGHYKEAHRVFRVALIVAGALGLICSLIMAFGAEWLAGLVEKPDENYPIPRIYYTILSLAPTTFIVAIASVFRGYFQGRHNTVPSAISQIIEQVFNAVFSVVLAYWFMQIALGYPNADILALGAAGGTAGTGVGAFVGLIVIFVIYMIAKPRIKRKLAKDNTPGKLESAPKLALRILRTAIPIIIGTAIFSISNLIDSAMVKDRLMFNGNFTNDQATSLFGILNGKYVTITTLPITISTSLAVAAIPGIVGAVALRRKREVNIRINAAIRIAMLLSVPAAVGIGVLADPILHMLFPKHPDGALLLQVGSISIIFLALTQIVTGMLQGIGKLQGPIIGAALGVIVKIIVNYYLLGIKEINIVGAVIGTIACYVVAGGFDLIFLIRTTKIRIDFKAILLKPIAASVIMGLGCFVFYYFMQLLLGINVLSIAVSIVAGVVMYFGFMLLFKGLLVEDLQKFPMGGKICRTLKRYGFI